MTIEAVVEHSVAEELCSHPFLAELAPEHLEELAGIATAALVVPASELAQLREADAAFGYALMRRLLRVVAGRLQSTRTTLIDTYLPAARRAGA